MKKLAILMVAVGLFGCKQDPAPTETTSNKDTAPAKPVVAEAIQNLFEEVNVVKMHIFGTNDAEPKQDEYPYVGKPVGENELKYLSDDLQPNEIGSIYAIYRTENSNFYILRVPGKYASSNIALAKWDPNASKLVKVMDLATMQCDEGMCHQQDAWLTDLDDDRSLDLIVRSQTNDNGKISDEVFNVFYQQPPGSFTQAPEKLAALAPQTSYVLQKF